MNKQNLGLISDFYEFTMSNIYKNQGMEENIAYFDLFFRNIPDNGGYVILAGLDCVIEYIQNISFDVDYLRSLNKFSESFLEYLANFKFTGDILAIPEGTPVFPNEPLLTVKAPFIQAQILETMLLLNINHQSLIATKTSRIVGEASGKPVMEFGARRAHGMSATLLGARSSIIGGAVGTSCTEAAKLFNVSAMGTMAHSFIQSFESEYEAFKTYAMSYPDDCTLLVDTYNTLKSGIPNAIKVFKEVGVTKKAIRLDSGDLAYLSKKARKMLDDAGFTDCKIVASNSLDEYLIKSLLNQGAKIDSFGVGENLITAKSDPVFGGVYKLCAIEKNGTIFPKIKLSETIIKVTNPGFKKTVRFYDKDTNKAIADVIMLEDEVIPNGEDYTIFDPLETWKKKTLTNYYTISLQKQIFKSGKLVYTRPNVQEIARYSKEELNTLWDEVKRIENPHTYYVDLSQKLWNLKNDMINSFTS